MCKYTVHVLNGLQNSFQQQQQQQQQVYSLFHTYIHKLLNYDTTDQTIIDSQIY